MWDWLMAASSHDVQVGDAALGEPGVPLRGRKLLLCWPRIVGGLAVVHSQLCLSVEEDPSQSSG